MLRAEAKKKGNADPCYGWQCQPTSEMKDKYGVHPGENEFFCDIPIFDGKEIPKDVKKNLSWRFEPFILRKASTLSKKCFSKHNLRRHAKEQNLSVKIAYSSGIVREDGQARTNVSLEEFFEHHMHSKKYDGDTQMERPVVFDGYSEVFDIEGCDDFTVPSLMRFWSRKTKLKFEPGTADPYLSMGASLSGTSFHAHSATLLMQVHGYKRWALYPDARSPPGGGRGSWPVYDWFQVVYPALGENSKPVECIQQPGDVIWIPERWSHATINLGDAVAVTIQAHDSESEAYDLQRKWTKSSAETGSVYLEELLKLLPENNHVKADLALEYMILGQPAKAEELLREILKEDQFHHDAMVLLVDIIEKKINRTGTGLIELKETLSSLRASLELNLRSYASNRLLARYFELHGDQMKVEHYKQRLDFLANMGIVEADLFAAVKSSNGTTATSTNGYEIPKQEL